MSALFQIKVHDRPLLQAKPFIKWVGGKRRVIPEIIQHLPANIQHYYEPFIGGGALFFYLRSQGALMDGMVTISDLNLRLIRTYKAVRDNVDGLIDRLMNHSVKHSKDYFYEVRAQDVDSFGSDLDVAAWFIYLNKTAFNGLYRVNKKNVFNAPFGKYANPKICDVANLRACSSALQNVQIVHRYFDHMRAEAEEGDFVYFDPPYVPVSVTSNFTSYTHQGFGALEQTLLRDMALELKEGGVSVLLSNSDHSFVRELYSEFGIRGIQVGRAINCKGDSRKAVGEVLIYS